MGIVRVARSLEEKTPWGGTSMSMSARKDCWRRKAKMGHLSRSTASMNRRDQGELSWVCEDWSRGYYLFSMCERGVVVETGGSKANRLRERESSRQKYQGDKGRRTNTCRGQRWESSSRFVKSSAGERKTGGVCRRMSGELMC